MSTGALKKAFKRQPLSWRKLGNTSILVVCSQNHVSVLMHNVLADGTLVAPAGKMGSLHCGWCNEDLPLKLADWP